MLFLSVNWMHFWVFFFLPLNFYCFSNWKCLWIIDLWTKSIESTCIMHHWAKTLWSLMGKSTNSMSVLVSVWTGHYLSYAFFSSSFFHMCRLVAGHNVLADWFTFVCFSEVGQYLIVKAFWSMWSVQPSTIFLNIWLLC